ncbi:hypothetical protein NDU88_007437 [Pleurodeles waltl]|uniref:Uncharacterized protein n=1 Tax=Pleurodeles waltl TaxID=8319 RepID=A0AAV7QKL9_PLEWA|nr:hypothetical protein NDU88_007437 [Pleurodeles waltl]
MGVHEEQLSSMQLGRPAGNQRMPVGVRAPSGHRLEERARSGAARLTSGDGYGPVFQDDQQLVSEEPSTSRGAVFVEQNYGLEEEVLDYDEGEEPDEGEIVQQRGEKKGFGEQSISDGGRSFGVFQETTGKAVHSNRQDGKGRKNIMAVNLPRGEKRREFLKGGRYPKG